jgi:hypothetical protein
VCPAWTWLGGESPLGKEVASTPSEPQGDKPDNRSGREAGAERSGKRNREPTNRNWIRGDADRGEQALHCEAPATKCQAT